MLGSITVASLIIEYKEYHKLSCIFYETGICGLYIYSNTVHAVCMSIYNDHELCLYPILLSGRST